MSQLSGKKDKFDSIGMRLEYRKLGTNGYNQKTCL